MSRMIFLNLPVRDLPGAIRFYEAIGCTKNEMFSDDRAASLVWSDAITFQLLTYEYFAVFSPKPIADARRSTGALIALACDSREDVDAMVAAAAGAGGRADVRAPVEMGFLYNRAFEDPDGHVFESLYMDLEAAATVGGGHA